MTDMIDKAGLKVAEPLARFIEEQALPGTGLESERFWTGLAALYRDFAPRNAALLAHRDELQARIDEWHRERTSRPLAQIEYQASLREIGYLVDEPASFHIAPGQVDDEVARLAGPQLVAPVLNARFLLNPANGTGEASTTRCTAPTRSPARVAATAMTRSAACR